MYHVPGKGYSANVRSYCGLSFFIEWEETAKLGDYPFPILSRLRRQGFKLPASRACPMARKHYTCVTTPLASSRKHAQTSSSTPSAEFDRCIGGLKCFRKPANQTERFCDSNACFISTTPSSHSFTSPALGFAAVFLRAIFNRKTAEKNLTVKNRNLLRLNRKKNANVGSIECSGATGQLRLSNDCILPLLEPQATTLWLVWFFIRNPCLYRTRETSPICVSESIDAG